MLLRYYNFITLTWFCMFFGNINGQVYYQPEQVHLSYGDTVNEIIVTWSTFNDTESVVEYGIKGYSQTAKGTSQIFIDGGPMKRFQYIHRVLLKDLQPDSVYVYHCGGSYGWSPEFSFKTPPAKDWQPRFAIFGDMGNKNAQSLTRLQKETQEGMYDVILHVGDFAYDMDTADAEYGDEFMKQIEPIAAYLPYMTCPGNHEERYNFSNYRERFSMPCGRDGYSYSIDIGPVHLISISTEVYYFLNFGIKPLIFQYEWLKQDLEIANRKENREKRPWIVIMGHRPMYCSNNNTDDCTHHETLTRVGLPFLHFFGLEQLLYDYTVDLAIWAHEHSYERLWPIYDYNIYNGSYQNPYVNPKAPVHIVTGSAGCQEGREEFTDARPEWSAFYSQDYGYTRMQAFNSTHLYLEQVSDDKDGAIIDKFWIVKDKHEAYPYANRKVDQLR